MQLFSYVLVYSTRKSFDVFGSADLFALMDGHERAFARFGGCAARCKYDSQKPVVLRWEGNQPIYNPRYLAFAAHYGIQPAAVRGKPNAKPRVERSFGSTSGRSSMAAPFATATTSLRNLPIGSIASSTRASVTGSRPSIDFAKRRSDSQERCAGSYSTTC